MKRIVLTIFCLISLIACKQEQSSEDYKNAELNITTSIYPETISKMFDAHGGIDAWNTMEHLYYEIEKPEANDIYDVVLKSRKSLIASEHHLLGFDGDNVWLKNLDTVTYKSNPKFYYNLMFYFYAMPFVLGDDGIHYAEAEPLEFEGETYYGVSISYEVGVGESPEDEYILYYNPETFKMEWLGYTVTYFSKEKSKEFHFIKYGDWQEVNGLLLPKTLSWYNYENSMPTTFRNNVNFLNVKLSKELPQEDMFKVPDSTMIVK
ncbi:MAG: DUF6503 family protein [Flavobacteriaceae bacterium]|nr:hypothetical protein [Flavobacteriaceae bacterium]